MRETIKVRGGREAGWGRIRDEEGEVVEVRKSSRLEGDREEEGVEREGIKIKRRRGSCRERGRGMDKGEISTQEPRAKGEGVRKKRRKGGKEGQGAENRGEGERKRGQEIQGKRQEG